MIDRFFFFKCKNNEYYSEKWEEAEITLNINQQQLQGWFVKVADYTKKPVIIYYGGNGEDISTQLSLLDSLSASLLLINYRGFGKSTGQPGEKNLFADALAIYDYLFKTHKIIPDNIWLIGRSIGSSIAAYVASQRHVKKLVLVTPFDAIANFVPNLVIFSPIRKYMQRYFNTTKYLEQVDGKILVIVADADKVIPKRSLESLLKKFQDQILLVKIKDANHQNIDQYPEYLEAIEKYVGS